jgi:hypothetical protein
MGDMARAAPAKAGGLEAYASLKREVRGAIAKDPFEATLVTVFGGAFLFYVAEKGKNPKVETYWDALVFVSTCLSVGYADVFARTNAGKAIASAVMTIGPALSGAMLDAPAAEKAAESREAMALQEAIVGKLGEILEELRAGRS